MSAIGFAASAASQVAPILQATSSARVIHPLSLVKVQDLDFGGITVTAAGTIVLNPDSNAVTTTGGVLLAGGTPQPATFVGSAQKKTVVNIRIPKQPIQLKRTDGPETLSLSNWTLQGQDKRELAAKSSFTFAVGGTVIIPANPVEGLYQGDFLVEVHYP